MIELATDDVIRRVAHSANIPIPWDVIQVEGHTGVVLRDGEPVAIIGCQKLWQGCGQVWAMIDIDKVRGHGLWLTRQIKRVLSEEMIWGEYRQIRAQCFYTRHADWLRLLGFRMEGVWLEAGPQFQNVYTLVYHRRH